MSSPWPHQLVCKSKEGGLLFSQRAVSATDNEVVSVQQYFLSTWVLIAHLLDALQEFVKCVVLNADCVSQSIQERP
jgi:hypothetical protein